MFFHEKKCWTFEIHISAEKPRNWEAQAEQQCLVQWGSPFLFFHSVGKPAAMYTWCEADWYNNPSCGSSALCQINITYPCHYNLVSPSLSSFISPLYLILLTFLFIPKRGPRFRSLITRCFFSTPCSHYPLLLHGCPQEEPEGGAWQTGHEHRVEKDADVKAMNLGALPPPRPASLFLSSLCSLLQCGTVPCSTQSALTCVSQDNHS